MLYLALLRGINVVGNKIVRMADLRALATRLGFEDARTLLNSGNLVFRGRKQPTSRIESLFERELDGISVLVRTAEEWASILGRNPFEKEARTDPGHLLVMVMKTAPAVGNAKALQDAIAGREYFEVDGREAYVVYPDGVGRSRFTHALIEKKLGTRCTGRNWNTMMKMQALAEG